MRLPIATGLLRLTVLLLLRRLLRLAIAALLGLLRLTVALLLRLTVATLLGLLAGLTVAGLLRLAVATGLLRLARVAAAGRIAGGVVATGGLVHGGYLTLGSRPGSRFVRAALRETKFPRNSSIQRIFAAVGASPGERAEPENGRTCARYGRVRCVVPTGAAPSGGASV
ncbi:MAG: hypothetical protein KF850_02670 [Labilithrix sp.]|nr:hypothetical protein [Labilithrix sp.]